MSPGEAPLVIIGAGGFGREVLAWARDAGWEVRGFIDHSGGDPRDENAGLLGRSLSALTSEDRVVVAVGDAESRWRLWSQVQQQGAVAASVVHPSAYVSTKARLGDGVILCPFSMISAHSDIGDNVVLNSYASVGHDCSVEDHCVLSPYATINGNVHLGSGVFMGTQSAVTPGRTVGEWSKISAGTILRVDAPSGTLSAGPPAKTRRLFRAPS